MLRKRSLSLPDLSTGLLSTVARADESACRLVYTAATARVQRANKAEVADAIQILAPAVADARLSTPSAPACLPTRLLAAAVTDSDALAALVVRVSDGLEMAARFPALWERIADGTDLPLPEDTSRIPDVIARLDAEGDAAGITRADGRGVAEAWFTVGGWERKPVILSS